MSTIQSVSSSADAWAAMRAQRSQMQAKMFAKVDTDGSGGVDKTELQSMLSAVSQKTGTDLTSNIDDTFTKFDTNADGQLSSDELGKGMHSLMPPPSTMDFAQSRGASSDERSKELFGKIDTNGDGTVDKTELQTVTDKIKADTGQDASDLFGKLDTDGDGKITQTEFDAGRPDKSTASAQGAGGPPPGGPPPGGGGGASASSDSSTVYDPLDTNKDGVVSELERLVGEIKDATTATSTATSTDSTASTSSYDLAKVAKQLYEQFALNLSSANESSLSVTA